MASFESLVFEIIARDKNASAAFDRFRRSIDNTSGAVDKNTRSLQQNQKTQTSVLGGFVGLGFSLSALATPLTAAAGGFVAFAGAAVPSVKKITTAMTGPGGLAAAWSTLDKGQRNAAIGVQHLSGEYSKLTKTLEPQVFQVFNRGLTLANSLLGPTAQLAAAAGKGIESFLVQFTAHSGIQQFVAFLAKEAGPALTLLGQDITAIAHAVFTLLESFGGLGLAELKVFTAVLTGAANSLAWLATHAPGLTSAAIALGGLALALSKFGLLAGALRLTGLSTAVSEIGLAVTATKGLTLAERGLIIQTTALEAITPFGWAFIGAAAVGGLVFAISKLNSSSGIELTTQRMTEQAHATGFNIAGWQKLAQSAGDASDSLAKVQANTVMVGQAAGHALALQKAYNDTQQQASSTAQTLARFLGDLEQQYGLTQAQAIKLAQASGVVVTKQGELKDGFAASIAKAKDFANANLHAHGPTTQLAADMQDFANKTLTATQRTTALTNALKLFFNPAVQADQDVITLKNDQVALAKALDASGGKTGLLTQKQRDARGAFDTYIGQVATAAQDAFNATGKTSSYNEIVKRSLPILLAAAGGNKTLRAEIRRLEDTLKGGITEVVTGKGTWDVLPSGKHIPGFAAGARVPGYGGGDRWPALLEGGESVVPKHLTPAVAPFLKAHGVPGFAAGVVGSYGPGSVGGLAPWLTTVNNQTLLALETAVARATFAGISQAQSGSGALGGDPGVNSRLARSMFPWPASMWPSYVSLEMQEAGFNRFARNPSSGAYGIPQALPPSKMPFAAQAAGGSHAGPQLGWMFGYIGQRYGNPVNAWGHEQAFGWYDQGGWLPPGVSLAVNNTGRYEQVIPAGGRGGGNHYTIIQNIPATVNKADVGREVVNAIRAYEKGSGAAWRTRGHG